MKEKFIVTTPTKDEKQLITPKENELREILEQLYKQAFNGDFYHKHSSEHITQALSQIIDLIIGKLPKEKVVPTKEEYQNNAKFNYGFNQCLTQLKTILKGLK